MKRKLTPTDAIITIDRLRIRARHGVLDQERTIGNVFEVTAELHCPAAIKATESDSIDDTLNYAAAVDIISRAMSVPSALLEHAAGRIAQALLDEFPQITSGRVTVAKLAPPISAELRATSFTLTF